MISMPMYVITHTFSFDNTAQYSVGCVAELVVKTYALRSKSLEFDSRHPSCVVRSLGQALNPCGTVQKINLIVEIIKLKQDKYYESSLYIFKARNTSILLYKQGNKH